MWPRKKRSSILSRRVRLRGPTALQPGSSMNAAASPSAAARSSSRSSGLTSGTQRQAPGALAEAQLDQKRAHRGANNRLAVEALDAEAGEAGAPHLLGTCLERLPKGLLVRVAQGQETLAAALHVEHRLGVEGHHVGTGHPGRA